MQDLVVLGLIPGTDIQITFNLWAAIVSTFVAAWLLRYSIVWFRRANVSGWLVTVALLFAVRHRSLA